MTRIPARAPRVILARRSTLLFDWRAEDYSLTARTGQILALARASKAYAPNGSGLALSNNSWSSFGRVDENGDDALDNSGLWIQPARTNALTFSQDFTNAAWTKTRITATANAARAADGTLSAGSLLEDTSTNTHFIDRDITHTANQPLVISVVVQGVGRTRCRLALLSSAGTDIVEARFVLTGAGSVLDSGVSGSGSLISKGIYHLGGDKYVIWVAGKVNAAATSSRFTLWTVDDSNNNSYIGVATKGLYAWGAQAELNTTHPSWYTGDNYARVADVATTSALWDLPSTLAVYFKILRPSWADASGTLVGPATPSILALGNGTPRITIIADSAARNLIATFAGASGTSVASVAIPSGSMIDGVALFTNIWTAPAAQLDLGSGLSAADIGASATTALSTTDLTLGGLKHSAGNELGSALMALKITDQALTLAQLRTRN